MPVFAFFARFAHINSESLMDNLHAYWRMEYVSVPKEEREEANPFASIPNLGDDRKALRSSPKWGMDTKGFACSRSSLGTLTYSIRQ